MVSNYNPLLDGEKIYVSMPTSSFEAQVANYSRRTAEVGLARVITTKGAPRFILEQGPEALEWLAFLEGMDVGRLSNAMRSGSLWRDVAEHLMYSETAKVVDTIRRAQLDVLKEKIDEYESLSRKTKEELYDAAANIKKAVRRRLA